MGFSPDSAFTLRDSLTRNHCRHWYHDAVSQPQHFRLSREFRLARRFRRFRQLRRFRLPAAMAVTLMLAACGNEPDTLDMRGRTMGTSYSVRIVAPADGSPVAPEALRQRVAARLEELENLFSNYRPDSEVSRFNAHPGLEWFGVSPDFLAVLEQSVSVSQLTGGAFDATVGPLVELWGFGAGDASGRVPDPEEVQRLLRATGSDHLQWRESPPAVRRTRPNVRLDFSAVAKGHAVDRIWELLSEAGLQAYLVEIGGEVRTRGRRADGRDWSVGIENPDGSGVAGGRAAAGCRDRHIGRLPELLRARRPALLPCHRSPNRLARCTRFWPRSPSWARLRPGRTRWRPHCWYWGR